MREQSVCKFRCIGKNEIADGFSILMSAVTGGSPDNDKFFKYTPSGRLELSILRHETAAQFEVNRCYMITIEEVEE